MRRELAAKQQVRPDHELPAGKLQISMSHALTTAAQGLTLAEKRVMMYAVAKLDAFKGDGGTPTGTVKLVAHDYAEQFGVDPDTAYTQLRQAGKGIFNRYIRFFEEGRKGPEEVMVRWVSSARYSPGTGTVTLRFTPEIAPHLLQLKNQFTKYKLAQASALRSIYSWRLLELLSQYASTGWRQIELDEFHHAMDTSVTARGNFKDCRQRVIEPAVKELRDKDGWQIDWTPIKTGRKVTALRFEFKRTPQTRLFDDA
jgi:plasmid replication initiation protein